MIKDDKSKNLLRASLLSFLHAGTPHMWASGWCPTKPLCSVHSCEEFGQSARTTQTGTVKPLAHRCNQLAIDLPLIHPQRIQKHATSL